MSHFPSRRWGLPATLLGLVLLVAAVPVSATPRGSGKAGSAASGTWQLTGSMSTARYGHTATLLSSGKVLVAGGVDNSGNHLSSAELYDPATGVWTLTGSMATPRSFHSATLLPSGKVLVAAGTTDASGNATARAELYDPASGTWTSTGSMSQARASHVAMLLPDGTVLVAGGWASPSTSYGLASAEIYHPDTGTWTTTASMNAGRAGPVGIALPNGQVLVAGGITCCPYSEVGLQTAELYDPGTASWSYTASMSQGRSSLPVILLSDGEVVVAGGLSGTVQPNLQATNTAEIYSTSTGSWSATTSMATARDGFGSALLHDGTILVAGGANGPWGVNYYLSSAELYDPTTGTWSATGSMTTARNLHTATLLQDGRVMVAGGYNGSALASAELYTPPSTVMHVASIGPFYQPAGSRYSVGSSVTIQSDGGSPVSGAKVTLDITLPGGSDVTMRKTTDISGTVSVQTTSSTTGTYTFTVTDVSKTDWTYDPSKNVETSDSVLVPTEMHVASVDPSYVPLGSQYRLSSGITIQNQNDAPLSGTLVTVAVTMPDGSIISKQGTTDSSGTTTVSLLSSSTGTYTFKVVGVREPPWTYDRSQNVETSDSITVGVSCVSPPSGLISWWPGEGNANDIWGTNNGTLENGATFGDGMVGQAFKLDGVDDYVSISDSPTLRPVDITIEGWFSFASQTQVQILFSKPVGAQGADSYAFWYDGQSLRGLVGNATAQGPDVVRTWTPQLGTWYHLAYTFEDATNSQTLYLNGAAVASGQVTLSIGYDGNPVLIGADSDYGTPFAFLDGQADEVSFYNRALSAAEIQSIYNAGTVGKCQP